MKEDGGGVGICQCAQRQLNGVESPASCNWSFSHHCVQIPPPPAAVSGQELHSCRIAHFSAGELLPVVTDKRWCRGRWMSWCNKWRGGTQVGFKHVRRESVVQFVTSIADVHTCCLCDVLQQLRLIHEIKIRFTEFLLCTSLQENKVFLLISFHFIDTFQDFAAELHCGGSKLFMIQQ